MFTDIVGFSRMMGENEERALEMLEKSREIHKKYSSKYDGKWWKEMGDGQLYTFSSSTEAVKCAIDIQRECIREELPLRIGIHEGEIIIENEDIIGDGVNIASRIVDQTPACRILISENVSKNVSNKPGIVQKFIAAATLKNIKEKARIFEVETDAGIIPGYEEAALYNKNLFEKKVSTQRKLIVIACLIFLVIAIGFVIQRQRTIREMEKSIAMLPLKVIGNSDAEAFSEGIREEILSQLQQLKTLSVRPRISSDKYANSTLSISEIGQELNAGYLLEGSAQVFKDSIKVTLQLILAREDRQLWSNTYSGVAGNLFKFQNIIGQSVLLAFESELISMGKIPLDTLYASLSPKESEQIEMLPSQNQEAMNQFIIAKYFYNQYGPEGLDKAILHYTKAIELDEDFTLAYASRSMAYTASGTWHGKMTPSEATPLALQDAYKALSLNAELGEAYGALASAQFFLEFDLKKAEANYEMGSNLDMGSENTISYSFLLSATGRCDRSLKILSLLIKEDSLNNPQLYVDIGGAYHCLGETEKAYEYYSKGYNLFSEHATLNAILSIYHFELGNYKESIRWAQRVDSLERTNNVALTMECLIRAEQNDRESALSLALQLQNQKEMGIWSRFSYDLTFAQMYAMLEDLEEAMSYLNASYETHNPEIMTIDWKGIGMRLGNLQGYPPFEELRSKLGLSEFD